MNRPRKVFGRVKVDLGDAGKWRFEMTRQGVIVRRKHQRHTWIITWARIIDEAEGQMKLL